MKTLSKLNAARVVAFLILSAPGFASASTAGCENATKMNSASAVSTVASAATTVAAPKAMSTEMQSASPAMSVKRAATEGADDPVLDDALQGVSDDYVSSQL